MPDFGWVFIALDLDLAVAVVAEVRSLEHAGAGEFGHGGGELLRSGNHLKGGARDVVLLEEIFLTLAVLADFHCPWRWVQRHSRCHRLKRGMRDVFKLHRGHSGHLTEVLDGLRIIKWQVDHLIGQFHRRSL